MNIEIRGTGNHNKGAEMMLLTILQEFKKLDKNITFVIPPLINNCEYEFYSKHNLKPKAWLEYKNFQLGIFANYLPKKILKMYGLVLDREIDVVLDASGFSYSDQWGERPLKMMAKYTKKWRKNSTKVIFMPQAFGDFNNHKNIKNMKDIINNSDIIYARDNFSYDTLKKLNENAKNIYLYPDFTILFKGIRPEYFNIKYHQICIVPNMRMIDKSENPDKYIMLFVKVINYLQNNKLKPFFLIHGGNEDLQLANIINDKLNVKIDIINEENPYFIKGIIELSDGLFGSRFHSLASSLYSGKVTLGTGWSHKYKYLFEEYDFTDGLIDLNISDEELIDKLNLLTNKENRVDIEKKFIPIINKHIQISTDMFNKIYKLLNLDKGN